MPDEILTPDRVAQPGASDVDLLDRIRCGETAALDLLVDRYWDPLISYAGHLLGEWDAAQDVTQEAFIRIWERRESWSMSGSVQALLYRIVRNLALDVRKAREREIRRARRVTPEVSAVPTPLEMTTSGELEIAFQAALDTLPRRRREVYELVRFEGLSYREVGEILKIAPQTVANHLSAAVSMLREQLSPHLGEFGPSPCDAPDGAQASRQR